MQTIIELLAGWIVVRFRKMQAIILIQAGHAALAVVDGTKVLKSKVIRKYMVRKTQGKSQLSHLESKGKSRLGSRIRLAQTKAFFEEINQCLEVYEKSYDLNSLYLSCSHKLKGVWMQSNPPVSKSDNRWHKIPYHVGRPNLKEIKRVLDLIRNPKPQEILVAPYQGALSTWEDWQEWARCGRPKEILEESWEEGGLHSFIELLNLPGVPQDPQWHPEGDVWVHTLLVVDAMKDICDREGIAGTDRTILMLAALCHDLGKPATTETIDGRVRARGHEQVGVQKSEAFLKRIDCPEDYRNLIKPLVREHLVYASFGDKITTKAMKKLLERLKPARVGHLQLLVEADHSGRPPLPKGLSDKAILFFEALLSYEQGMNS